MLPTYFIPHGAGPLPILGDELHTSMVEFLKSDAISKHKPKAIIMISAHWEETIVKITGNPNPALIYDYSNFPPESYSIQYPAKGDSELATKIHELLEKAGIKSEVDNERGFDHGMFIPLKLIYPNADIPCVQISLVSSLDPNLHQEIGKALASLRSEGILFIGSGLSFHGRYRGKPGENTKSKLFDDWLNKACVESTPEERKVFLNNWSQGPESSYCHPREEHLLPLMVVSGAAHQEKGKNVYSGLTIGSQVSGFQFGE